MRTNTTPVPNALFDIYLKDLTEAELKLLLVVIRQTLGWVDRRSAFGRKERDWISNSQLQLKSGSSRRAISSATEALINKNLIDVFDYYGNPLNAPSLRRGKQRMFYRPSTLLLTSHGDKEGKHCQNNVENEIQSADFAEELRKIRRTLVQKMQITKETEQN
jgi:hypothetical protein